MKAIKRVLAFLICAVLLCGSFAYAADFSSYTAISTKEDLNAVRNDLDGSYYLTQDIVFTGEDFQPGGAFYNEGSGWLPIGSTASAAFTGILDGNGYTVSGIEVTVNSTETVYSGLFGYSKGTVKNLTVTDITINIENARYAYAGAIAGIQSSGLISDCSVTGIISCAECTVSASVGGVVGYALGGTLTNCSNSADVSVNGSTVNVGGIVGSAYVAVSKCENLGRVEANGRGDAMVGGIVGSGRNVTDCHNVGYIYGHSKCDGMVGGISGKSDGTVSGCYSAGPCKVTANTYEYCGGVVGKNNSTLQNCYYLSDITSAAVGEGTGSATAVTVNNYSNTDTFADFDFTDVWVMDGNVLKLKHLNETVGNKLVIATFTDHSGRVVSVRYVVNGEVINEEALPELPQRTGYITIGWSGEIVLPFSTDTTVAPLYEKDASFGYSVTAENATVTYPDGQDTLRFEDRVTVTATGTGFSYWMIGDTVVSTSEKYSFLAMGNTQIKAVYNMEAPGPQVYLQTAPVLTELDSTTYKFSMAGSSFIPEGYTFKEAGILLAQDDRSESVDDFVIGSAAFTVVKQKVNAAYANSQFMITVKNVTKGKVRSGRAYMIVTDGQGNELTYYSSEISVASLV